MHDGAVISSSDDDRRAVVMPGPALPVLTTARLRLTPVAEHELDELLALHADPRAFAEDPTEPLTDRAQMRWVLRRWRESWGEHGLGYLSIRRRRTADEVVPLPEGLLGVVGLTPLTTGDRPVLSAYWRLAPAATGRGVATEAMRAVLAHPQLGGRAGGGAGGAEIVAVTAGNNRASRALASRLGFVPAPPERSVPGGRGGDVLLVLAGS